MAKTRHKRDKKCVSCNVFNAERGRLYCSKCGDNINETSNIFIDEHSYIGGNPGMIIAVRNMQKRKLVRHYRVTTWDEKYNIRNNWFPYKGEAHCSSQPVQLTRRERDLTRFYLAKREMEK